MKIAGILLFFSALISTFLLAFGFRDFSFQLTAMFMFSVVGLPLSTYLILKPKSLIEIKDDDGCEVEGLFTI